MEASEKPLNEFKHNQTFVNYLVLNIVITMPCRDNPLPRLSVVVYVKRHCVMIKIISVVLLLQTVVALL